MMQRLKVFSVLAVAAMGCGLAADVKACAPVMRRPAMSIKLTDARAAVVPAGDIVADSITPCGGSSAVRGSFMAEAESTDEAMSSGDKSWLIFVFDRNKAAKSGCPMHPEILFNLSIYDASAPAGMHPVKFGYAGSRGEGGMALGVYHAMMQRGCIAAPLGRERQE